MRAIPSLTSLAALLVATSWLAAAPAAAQGRAADRIESDRPISRGALGLPARGGPRDTVPAGTRGPTTAAADRQTAQPATSRPTTQ
jgi:hypothetical protein